MYKMYVYNLLSEEIEDYKIVSMHKIYIVFNSFRQQNYFIINKSWNNHIKRKYIFLSCIIAMETWKLSIKFR